MKIKLIVYQFPWEPPTLGVCALDDHGDLWINPALLGDDWHTLAFRSRALSFFKLGPTVGGSGMIGLASILWIKRHSDDEQRANLEQIEKSVREHINGAHGQPSLCADVSYPGDPDFIDGLLGILAGTKN